MDKQSLLTVLNQLGIRAAKVNERRGWVDFCCPLARWTHAHGTDRSPSAGARIEPGGVSVWHCYGCKHKGSIARLAYELGRYRGADYTQLITALQAQEESGLLIANFGAFEDIGMGNEPPAPLEEAIYQGLWPNAWEVPAARDYLMSRNICRQTAEEIGLLFDDDRERILFPVRDGAGALFGFSGRLIHSSPTLPKILDYEGLPKRHMILGAHRWRERQTNIIIEGLFGFAHLVEIGVEEENLNIGALLGSTMTEEKAMVIRLHGAPTYLWLDNDKAGENGIFGIPNPDTGQRSGGAIELLQAHVPLFVPEWPPGKADPDQLSLEDILRGIEETQAWGAG